ncbi:hypothetical protein P3T18_003069 [Paraburkholderia sp. GAS199]|uniref:hypothetical protein n=1 Tax=Paraburkholderia sp. GAS199 TaxID=3035126 RepID=UPI003D1F9452
MNELLKLATDAHGGLENWNRVSRIDVRLNLSGYLFEKKKHPDGLNNVLVSVETKRLRTVIAPFPTRGFRGIFEDGAVYIQTDAGEVISRLDKPREAYEGHTRETPWSDLQFLYFIGYAFWNYLTTPFLLAAEGINTVELEPHQENGQTWRVLGATFPSSIDTHCAEQKFYFNEQGIQQRHDYFTDVAKGDAAHYTYDTRLFDGFLFATRRRVVGKDQTGYANLSGPSSVWALVEAIVVHKQ